MMNKGNRNFRIAVVIACVLAVVVIYDRVQPSTACTYQSSQPEVLLGSGTDADVVTKLLLRASGLKSRVTITDPPFTWVYDTKPECANFISLLASNNGFAASMETQLFRTILFEQCKQLDANGRAPLVVDVGGNAGYFTSYAAAMGCRVIAFEPFPHMMNFLELHVSLNNFGDRVTAVPAAVSSASGDAWLNPVCTDSGLSHLTNSAGAGGTIRVRTVRLSDVINEDILLLKIDVEGFEDHVFKGMEGLLKKHKVKNIICETKKTGDVAYKIATINSLINRNYSVYSYPEYYGNDAPYPVYTNLPEKVLIPVSTLASNDWIPHEDMFYTIQKDSLKFE